MQKLNSNVIGIDQGNVVLFSDFEHDGEMWKGEGKRKIVVPVTFSETYTDIPNVYASISMWDMSNNANIRADLQTEDITETGFNIVFRTWGDTQVARIRVAWQSIGPVVNEDLWDI